MTPPGFHTTEARRSWGRVARGREEVASPSFQDEAVAMANAAAQAGRPLLATGLGRSYGDSGLNLGGAVIDMRALDRILAFDPHAGVVRAEAGLSLDALLRWSTPRGWFAPTTPGTRYVTLGGAVANDVHGKNHHRAGSFGRFVRAIGLWRSDGGVIEVLPGDPDGLHAATVGGLGLTGVILWVELQLAPIASAFLDQETVAFRGLDAFFALAEESGPRFEHTVAWIDCLAGGRGSVRGLFSRANWRADHRLVPHRARPRLTLPIDAPGGVLNTTTLTLFNALYAARGEAGGGRAVTHYASVFHPLDAVGGWNRLYGRRGFFQHQSVMPPDTAREGLQAALDRVSRSGQGSPLAVLKVFGDVPSPGLMSFPRPGATLALDFPNRGADTLALLDDLDAVVREAGGRLYPAKDGRMSAAMFRAGYPNLDRFAKLVDPALSSSFWRRTAHD